METAPRPSCWRGFRLSNALANAPNKCSHQSGGGTAKREKIVQTNTMLRVHLKRGAREVSRLGVIVGQTRCFL